VSSGRRWCRGKGCCHRRGGSREAEYFHRAQRRDTVAGVAACYVDVTKEFAVSCEIAPRRYESETTAPRMADAIVDVHLVRWVGRISPAAHDPHHVIGAANRSEGNRPGLARGSRDAGNGRDRISDRVIGKRVITIMYRSAVPSAAPARVDVAVEEVGCWYVAERDGQLRALLHPNIRCGRELPNRIGHRRVDSETAQNVELVIEYREAAR